MKEETLFQAMKARNVEIMHRPYAGSYYLKKGLAHGDIMIFRDWYKNGVMHRIGIESYLVFANYRKFHIFPAYLVEKPLPKTEFAGINVSIARNPIELTKYLFPMNWKVEVKPAGCQ